MSSSTKIIIIDGNEFQVAADMDNEAIRAQLATQFPMAQAATIQTGTRTIDGVDYTTVEFVKKIGTKGMDGAAIHAALAGVPATWKAGVYPPSLQSLLAGQMTIAACCAAATTLVADLHTVIQNERRFNRGGSSCARSLASLPAVADTSLAGW